MVTLPYRRPPYMVPAYSLTGDLLSYSRCGLQYRYQNGSALPPSRPVQLWFGEFIHGVMELAVRDFQTGARGPLPWNDTIIDSICDTIADRLAREGKTARSRAAETMARSRSKVSINELGPLLFPLVDTPEVALSGTRVMPIPSQYRSFYYEVTGRIDVLTSIRLDMIPEGENSIVDSLRYFLPTATRDSPFEVIVDYKGMRRAPTNSMEWDLYTRQLQTYAWLRQGQPGALPVRAGLVIFVNEFWPARSDFPKLRDDIANNATDVRPQRNSIDEAQVLGGPQGVSPYGLSWGFRLDRSLRFVNVDVQDQNTALAQFDGIVSEIEASVNQETTSGSIVNSWPTRPVRDTCVACDFRTMCPDSLYRGPAVTPLGRPESQPEADEE